MPHFVAISTDNSAINGPIPREIGNLNVLLEFKAYETNIAGRIPREIGGATSLIVLELGTSKRWNCCFAAYSCIEIKNITNTIFGGYLRSQTIPICQNKFPMKLLGWQTSKLCTCVSPALWICLDAPSCNFDTSSLAYLLPHSPASHIIDSTDLTGDIPELPTSLFGPENCRFGEFVFPSSHLVYAGNERITIIHVFFFFLTIKLHATVFVFVDGGCFGNLDAAIAQGCNVDGNCAWEIEGMNESSISLKFFLCLFVLLPSRYTEAQLTIVGLTLQVTAWSYSMVFE